MKDCTDITLILDRSGSMGAVINDTLGGVNAFIEKQKDLPGEAVFTLIQFDHEYLVTQNHVPMKEAFLLNTENYVPRGMTALHDAIGRTINAMGKRFNDIPEEDRPNKVIVVIQTDGMENCSKEFNKEDIKQMITHQKEKYNWEFVFMAADLDAADIGQNLGFFHTRSYSSKSTIQSWAAVNNTVTDYRNGLGVSITDEKNDHSSI